MTLLYMNGFNHLGATADISKEGITYGGTVTIESTDPRHSGGKQIKVNGYSSYFDIIMSDNTSLTSGVIGFAHKYNPNSGYETDIRFNSLDSSYTGAEIIINGSDVSVSWGPYNVSRLVWMGNTNSNAWNYYELKYNNADSPNGYMYLRINGVQVAALTNTDTLYSNDHRYIARFRVQRNCNITDIYHCNLEGTENNDFLGDCRVETLFVSANGTTNNGTASTGSNYECVDDASPNDDTDYVTLDAVDEIELYTMDNVATFDTDTTIHAIQVKSLTVKPSVGYRVFQLGLRTNSTNYFSSDMGTGVGNYSYQKNIWELNPNDSAAWEEADLNALESGIKITA